jgi:phage-related tail protein
VVEGVNDKIHDELISHDIALRRVDGGVRKEVEARIDRLASDLKALMAKIDPFGTERADAQERRLKKLDEESAKLIAEAYGEISSGTRSDMKRVAAAESEVSVKVIEDALT